jgi:hypothetical protein
MGSGQRDQKEDAKGTIQDYTKLLVRDDIQTHLQTVYALYERINRIPRGADVSVEPTAALAHTYLLTTDKLQLFSLYRLAIQVNQFEQHVEDENTHNKNNNTADSGRITRLRWLYADQWTQMTAKVKKGLQTDFDSTMQAGKILASLVVQFGTGILLTCTPKMHEL